MHWLYLLLAGIFEVAWAVGLKYSRGFTRLRPSVLTVLGMIASFGLLAAALKQLPLGTAYAIWTGIGTVGTFFAGILLFQDAVRLPQVVCVGLILTGIVGLKLLSPH